MPGTYTSRALLTDGTINWFPRRRTVTAKVKCLRLAITCLMLSAAVGSAPGAALMERVLEKSDCVVVGEVVHGTYEGSVYSFTLVVYRSLRGDLKPGLAVPVSYNVGVPGGGRGEFHGQFGLWFLANDKSGGLRVVPGWLQPAPFEFSYYPLPRRGSETFGYSADSPLLDKVFSELAQASESAEPGQVFYQLANGVLRCVGTPASTSVRETLERWSHSASANLFTLGLAGLIALEDADALQRSQNMLSTIKQSQLAGPFSSAVSDYRSSNPEGVKALGEMVAEEAGILGLRSAAAFSLRSIHSRESLPYLAKLLDSQDAKLRGDAVAGFTFFVNDLPVMTPGVVAGMAWTKPVGKAPYKTPETDRFGSTGSFERPSDAEAYAQFWKTWWAQNKAKLGFAE